MTRIGPYGDGTCSRSYAGTLALRGDIQTVEIDCYVPKTQPRYPRLKHGGSANLAIRDGRLAVLGNGHLKILAADTFVEQTRIPTVVTCGHPGWDYINRKAGQQLGMAGHSVPSGLATLYWLEYGLVSIRCGGDIGSKPEGHELVRVEGNAAIPDLPNDSNQREWIAAADGNPLNLFTLGGHAFGRAAIGCFAPGEPPAVGIVKAPNLINNPVYLSTPEAHYLIAPGKIRQDLYRKQFIEHMPGLSVYVVRPDKSVSLAFVDATMGIWAAWDGNYAPNPWCLQNVRIYAVTKATELSVINVATWGTTRYAMPSMGFKPRLAVNRAEVPVVCGLNQLCRPATWTVPVSLDAEALQTNKQFSNHLLVDDSNVYLARLIGGSLLIDVRSLKDGKLAGKHTVPIPGADASGQCHDFFADNGALYALVTPREPMAKDPRKFSQFVVRVS